MRILDLHPVNAILGANDRVAQISLAPANDKAASGYDDPVCFLRIFLDDMVAHIMAPHVELNYESDTADKTGENLINPTVNHYLRPLTTELPMPVTAEAVRRAVRWMDAGMLPEFLRLALMSRRPEPLRTMRGTPGEFLALVDSLTIVDQATIAFTCNTAEPTPEEMLNPFPIVHGEPSQDIMTDIMIWYWPIETTINVIGKTRLVTRQAKYVRGGSLPLAGQDDLVAHQESLVAFYKRAAADLGLSDDDIDRKLGLRGLGI